ncbi:MAG: GTPase Era [Deltaproteobacteria bacterium]|nr:GTPase Era [Deltaproteobacteria bacterium]MBW2016183.1 GTPase Era [Deltaproteobacteria bacterium]MBW2130332.1 GTPase Era [Deltaproteobacteria bacterium]MBW2302700.1 GTPase Era [Deltaproteobacteria bacterium]
MKKNDKEKFLSGFIAIVGPPNVGKSTLLNRLLGRKVAIVSPKPQTTRNRVLGVYHEKGCQMVFLDTPGIHRTRTPLHKSMVASAQAALVEVDLVTMMIDMTRPDDPEATRILRDLKRVGNPAILAINKIDRGSPERLLPIMETFSRLHDFKAIVPISALKGEGIREFLAELRARLTPGPPFFPESMTTDQTEPFLVSEFIREKVYLFTRKELPYSAAVTVEGIEEAKGRTLMRIHAKIHVESESQKAILIGKGGNMIKAIGQSARKEIERVFGVKVYLDLMVRVEKNWSKDPKALRKLGY